jgi:hypothetical protein
MPDLDLESTIRGYVAGQNVFQRYTLQRILGRGGMGVVWLARDRDLERDVALKFLPEVVAMDPQAVHDLKRETRRSLELTHSHIIRIYDFVQSGAAAAISMEFVQGDTLAARKLEQPGQCFTPGQIAPWVTQLCEALAYAHEKAQVVHRDLKPANLMIDARGDLKVADFGIAASVSDSVSRVSVQSGSSGTPVYMSPQQMMGERPAISDDVYALGATLFDLLTGKPPFHSGNIIAQVQAKVPPAIAARRAEFGAPPAPGLNDDWESTIADCLAKEPGARPRSVREVAERLGLMARSVPVLPPPPFAPASSAAPVPETAPASTRASRRGLVALVVALLVLALVGGGYYAGVYRPEQLRLAAAEAELARVAARAAAERQAEEERAAAVRAQAAAEARARAEAEERARVEAEQQAYALVLARLEGLLPDSPEALRDRTARQVETYLLSAPEPFRSVVEPRWRERLDAWNAERQRREAAHPWTTLAAALPTHEAPWELPVLAATPAVMNATAKVAELRPALREVAARSRPAHPDFQQSVESYRAALSERARVARDAAGGQARAFATLFRGEAEVTVPWPELAATDLFLEELLQEAARRPVREWSLRPDFGRGPARVAVRMEVVNEVTDLTMGGKSMPEARSLNTDSRETLWTRMEAARDGFWLQARAEIVRSAVVQPGSVIDFRRSSQGWTPRLVSGALVQGDAAAIARLQPSNPAMWLDAAILPAGAPEKGRVWDVPLDRTDLLLQIGLLSPSGSIRGRVIAAEVDAVEPWATIEFTYDVSGTVIPVSAGDTTSVSQRARGTLTLHLLLEGGYVGRARSEATISSTTTVTPASGRLGGSFLGRVVAAPASPTTTVEIRSSFDAVVTLLP